MSTTPPPRSWLRDPWAWGLGLSAALLLLPNLESSGLLWQDEAETAVLARTTLQCGYPKVSDGVNRINPSVTAGPGGAWTYHPWLQFYLTALAFSVAGPTTAAARFPFAALGVLCVVMTYGVARSCFTHRRIAQLTGLLTLTSVPLLLHLRQCRYYALATFATLWVVWCYTHVRAGRRGALGWLVVGLLVLFHSHHGAFAPTLAALIIDSVCCGMPAGRRHLGVALGLVTLGVAPWCFILDIGQHQGTFSAREMARHAQFYLRELNHFVLPLGLFLIAWIGRGIRPVAWWRSASAPQRRALGPIALIVACNLLFIVTVPWQRHFRYLIHLVPLMMLLEAALLWKWLGTRPRWLRLVTALLIVSDLLHYSTPYVVAQTVPRLQRKIAREHGVVAPRSLLAEYLYELTHRYRGPLEGIIETLRREGLPGETVKIPYGDHAVMFYAPWLKVEDLNRFTAPTFPDWIIPRRDWVPGDFFTSPYFRQIERAYDRLEINAPDLVWENRPDPGYHKFRVVTDAPRLALYHRRSP